MDEPWAIELKTLPSAHAWISAHPVHGISNQVEMVSFGMDPQWGGLLFSLCSRHEETGAVLGAGGGLFYPSTVSDTLSISASNPGAAADFVNLVGSVGLDIYSMSSVWAIVVETAKATGMVVLLGVGSLLFYRVYHSLWPKVRSRIHGLAGPRKAKAASASPVHAKVRSSSSGEDSDAEDSDDIDSSKTKACDFTKENDALAEEIQVTGMYFGPRAESSLDGSTTSLPLAEPVRNPTRAPSSKLAALRKARRRSKELAEMNRHSLSATWMDDEARDADVSEGSRSPRTPPEERDCTWRGSYWRGGAKRGWRGARGWRGSSLTASGYQLSQTRSSGSSASLSPEYPPHFSRIRNVNLNESPAMLRGDHLGHESRDEIDLSPEVMSLRRENSTDSLARRFMARDESFESLFSYNQGRRRSLTRMDSSMDSLYYPKRFPRDDSLDSLGFPKRTMTRGSSFDSTCSEMSLDASLIAELEAEGAAAASEDNKTVTCLEELQREIDQLKSNCLSLDEEFETVKCNMNLPGMSSLLDIKGDRPGAGASAQDEDEQVRAARARACFTGLYTLTHMTSSPSLDLSDCQPSSLESNMASTAADELASPSYINNAQRRPATVNEEPPLSLEWDEEGVSAFVDPADSGVLADMDLGASAANMEVSETTSTTEGDIDISCKSDSMLTSSVSTCDLETDLHQSASRNMQSKRDTMQLHLVSENTPKMKTVQSPTSPESWVSSDGVMTRSSSSSGVSVLSRSMSWGSAASSALASAAGTPATPSTHLPIGERIGVLEYASREWQGNTKKAQTMLKGYTEIPGLLGLGSLRVVRGDNYCAVRGAIFQALVRGLPLPPGRVAANRCAQLLADPAGHWLRSWNFAGRLPYSNDNVEDGIRDCLLSLDSTVERLESASDRESALANMLNADPWLDARLCESVKLLLLVSALELKAAADLGKPLPFFAELLFARDSSATPSDFMNNHLSHVGDTAGLEQVEMFLLGYALGIRIRVVRPCAFGSQDYVCSYANPQDVDLDMSSRLDNRRLVDLIAEDDRHYNVLLQ